MVSDCLVYSLTTVSHILKERIGFLSRNVNSFPDLEKKLWKRNKTQWNKATFTNINLNETSPSSPFLLFWEHIHIYFTLTSHVSS